MLRIFLISVYRSQYFKYIRKIVPWRALIAWETVIFHIPEQDALECVGPGWAGLIHEAYRFIRQYRPFRVSVTQVKEKYGTLRIYVSSGPGNLFDEMEEILEKSSRVCEQCGRPGKTRWDLGWVLTLCDSCIDKKAQKDV